ncbi:MAG: dihydroneopterin aldolase [Verrucomicrobia bacterium]|nr:MAG: dihydroneopterin aldolase [Verrucomicrobiota bacterium]
MSKISIVDLEVFYCIGLTDEERAKPQRLLLSIDLSVDIDAAAIGDRIEKTINYHVVVQDLLKYGEGRSWKLLEKLVTNIADRLLAEYRPQAVMVEVKKFAIPQARYVSVTLTKARR